MKLLRNTSLVCAVVALLSTAAIRPAHAQAAGESLPAWSAGTLDIHHISTGRGNSTLLVLPDGTTLLLDAGALEGKSPRYTAQRPDASRTAGDWIARYLRGVGATGLDYAMLTHFHSDHMGQITDKSPVAKSAAYKLSGITEVGETIRIRKMLDRGWPDYNYPAPLANADMVNYRAFLKWQSEQNGMKVERFQPGRNDQIVLQRDPKAYRNFEIRNVAANGEVWTGVGANTRQHFPPLENVQPADRPSENMCSAGFRVSYGAFDYFTGGDIPGIPFEGYPEWHDVETPVARVVGPVEVAVLNHHGYIDSENAFFIGALRPRAWVLFAWDSAHPTARVYSRLTSPRIYPGPRQIFANNMHEANKTVVVGLDKLASQRGHIVVRVAPGGKSYRIYTLDDSSETHTITAVHGPYESQ
ncbi:MAG TPA: MBL fold metallo-hydrolase [Bryobacteraceae bacterium]|nr:MBL fold metallo-hydrolase [Bryobacteraceae bacterium]